MKILVTGPESSGTKMLAHLLTKAGADVTHYTPRSLRGDKFLTGEDFDAVVVTARDGFSTAHSMVENYHAKDLEQADFMIIDALKNIFNALTNENTYWIPYEAIILNNEAIYKLAERLGLSPDFEHDNIGNANDKYYGGDTFADNRNLSSRGVRETTEYYSKE